MALTPEWAMSILNFSIFETQEDKLLYLLGIAPDPLVMVRKGSEYPVEALHIITSQEY